MSDQITRIIEIKNKIFALTVIFFLLFTSHCFCLSGKCIRVIDGDTIVVFSGNKKIKVRLYGVDCPETKQKYGKQAGQFTSRHAMEKTVWIEEKGSAYNRVVGIVYIKSLCLNSGLLKSGYAWYAPKYCRGNFCVTWKSYALLAKKESAGLWSDPDPVAPWDFRVGKTKTSVKHNDGCFQGNTSSKKFHRQGCKYFNCQKCSVVFKTLRETIKKGFVACRIYMP